MVTAHPIKKFNIYFQSKRDIWRLCCVWQLRAIVCSVRHNPLFNCGYPPPTISLTHSPFSLFFLSLVTVIFVIAAKRRFHFFYPSLSLSLFLFQNQVFTHSDHHASTLSVPSSITLQILTNNNHIYTKINIQITNQTQKIIINMVSSTSTINSIS